MQLKKIDPTALLYHYIERSPTQFVLFDDKMDMPIAWGSRNLVDSVIRRLSSKVNVVYYKRDLIDKASFKKKVVYNGRANEAKKTKGATIPNAVPGLEP